MDAPWYRWRWLVVALLVVSCFSGQVAWLGSPAADQMASDTTAEFGVGRSGMEETGRFPAPMEAAAPAGPSHSRTASRTAQTSMVGCTLVELYPGYPSYRGNITGVMPHWNGLVDWACLEDLEQNHRSFDQVREDRANQQAAGALGINGSQELWTWENWLQIEAERGLVPSCYTCLMLDPSTTPIRTDVQPDPGDPRLTTGFMGGRAVVGSLLRSVGNGGAGAERSVLEFYGNDDYVLRALAYITGGTSLNAQELHQEMQRLVAFAISPSGDLDDLPSWGDILHHGIWRHGGYTWTPGNAAMEDQILLIWKATSSVSCRGHSTSGSSTGWRCHWTRTCSSNRPGTSFGKAVHRLLHPQNPQNASARLLVSTTEGFEDVRRAAEWR